MINCMYALDDFTEQNGATCVVPGDHRWPEPRDPRPEEVISAAMPAGSVLIYLGSLVHGGGANHSAQARTGVVISYNLAGCARRKTNTSPFPTNWPARCRRGYNGCWATSSTRPTWRPGRPRPDRTAARGAAGGHPVPRIPAGRSAAATGGSPRRRAARQLNTDIPPQHGGGMMNHTARPQTRTHHDRRR